MADYMNMAHDEYMRQIAALDRQLASMGDSMSNEIIDTVAKEAAEELQKEQKRFRFCRHSQIQWALLPEKFRTWLQKARSALMS